MVPLPVTGYQLPDRPLGVADTGYRSFSHFGVVRFYPPRCILFFPSALTLRLEVCYV